MEAVHGAGVTISPVAFLVINKENVKLIPVNHTSAVDKLLDYVPDLFEKATQIINKCLNDKKEEVKETLKNIKEQQQIKEEISIKKDNKNNNIKKVTVEKEIRKPEEKIEKKNNEEQIQEANKSDIKEDINFTEFDDE